MTASLAYRKNEAAILRGDVPEKYTRLLPHIPGDKILEVGAAEGVLALLLAQRGKDVTALEMSFERHEAAKELLKKWGAPEGEIDFQWGDIRNRLGDLKGFDTLVAIRMIYYLRDDLDAVFAEVAKHIPNVVLCGNKNRAARWRAGEPDKPDGPFNKYASREGMREILTRHGYTITKEITDGDEIVVGRMV